ncbi:MAG: Smr/MutS family protein, partial [Oscillospiraceae bacterium]|nr:Smr/MutS family protein [Oscillospiraceae bacterium]
GRFVVPVKQEHRAEVPGLVHDTSGSGATLFVEPMAVVEANNEIRILQSKEADEIERILAALSAEAGTFADAIIADYDTLVALNLIFAKAHLAYNMKASAPNLSDSGYIKLARARHPLIDPKKVVPVDVELGGGFDTLVITGPNTGGKTVTLKTLGLLTLMVMCGLLPTVGDGSTLAVFDRVLADIGDEQSIEQSLSTFSSHMTNLIRIIGEADSRSLVLLDELGAGTDPVEGAALAAAILERLRAAGARIAATTHYAELKVYAIHTPGVENGCCEFDVATLRPTYRLLVGIPGRSNAFAISLRLGLDQALVDRAQSLVGGDSQRLEEVVLRLDAKRQALEGELAVAEQARAVAEQANAKAIREVAELEAIRERETEKAKTEARRIVERARLDAEALVRELEALRKQKEAADFSARAGAARSSLRATINKMEDAIDPVTQKKAAAYTLPRPLRVGDSVLIVDIDKKGVVTALGSDGGPAEVLAGIIKTRVAVNNLRLLENNEGGADAVKTAVQKAVKSRAGSGRATRSAATEIDLRGFDTNEAVLEADRFLDNAVLTGLERVTLIHGKGTGALRSAIQQHLKRHPSVKGFRLGAYGEGETGVTVVELK